MPRGDPPRLLRSLESFRRGRPEIQLSLALRGLEGSELDLEIELFALGSGVEELDGVAVEVEVIAVGAFRAPDERLRDVVAAGPACVDATGSLVRETTLTGGSRENRVEAETAPREDKRLIEALAEAEENESLAKALLRLFEHFVRHVADGLGDPGEHPRLKVV